ncbi:MAG TPA: DEAD/DEAH box helicase, partial [Acidimicrobiia bacterium]|nr:DEAD/DEAH box helicase [Acidimicrobiia bacterium]
MESPTADTDIRSSFADLGVSAAVVASLTARGITEPFPIQTLTIPDGLAGRDVCGRAQTGSGKTIAFGIPLVERTEPADPGRPRALVLVPTRELCSQVAEEIEPMAAARGLGVMSVYGGVPIEAQISRVARGVEIVVATPGRLIDLLERKVVDLVDLVTVVIDEADQMADMGFLPQVHRVMRSAPNVGQTMLFSATLDGEVQSLVQRYLDDPVRYEVEQTSDIIDTQDHRFILVHHMDKAKLVAAITASVSRSLVFVSTKRGADRVAETLQKEGVRAAAIHGDLRQSLRERTLEDLASGKRPVVVATNVAARGLHIDDIDVVIHYDPPQDYKSFIHRSGRTARAGETGLVVTLVEWDQVEEVKRI